MRITSRLLRCGQEAIKGAFHLHSALMTGKPRDEMVLAAVRQSSLLKGKGLSMKKIKNKMHYSRINVLLSADTVVLQCFMIALSQV